jgi:hypothetical protein
MPSDYMVRLIHLKHYDEWIGRGIDKTGNSGSSYRACAQQRSYGCKIDVTALPLTYPTMTDGEHASHFFACTASLPDA